MNATTRKTRKTTAAQVTAPVVDANEWELDDAYAGRTSTQTASATSDGPEVRYEHESMEALLRWCEQGVRNEEIGRAATVRHVMGR